ncbi:MAG: TetR family transcriptional regulator [Candidatus Cybelea sp.]
MHIYLDYLIKNVNRTDAANKAWMSPRPYQAGERRQAATKATRSRILEAARELLTDLEAVTFSIDAVAARADVARMTVYYQFKSKGKLLEALFDDFGVRTNMKALGEAVRNPDITRGLSALVDAFCHLWKTEGTLVRRLNAMAGLDPEVDRALQERGGWRREALGVIVGRRRRGRVAAEIVDLLYVLTSFETYDTLASAGRSSKEIVAILQRAVAAVVAA